MMASFTPRVRTAGSANSSPIGTVPAIPITTAASNGTLVLATRRPAIKAPTPANAYCASEICPAYPVTTTIDKKAADRQRAAADHDHHDDDEERDRVGETRSRRGPG